MKNILFIMPFGVKNEINFDDIYKTLFKILKKLNKSVSIHRVDFMKSTNIDAKMYKGIIAADIVVADLTTLNANVIYELGVRHSFADKTTKLIMNEDEKKTGIPFNFNHLNVHKYKLDDNKKITNVKEICLKILEEETEKDSLIFKTLPDLKRKFNESYMKVFDEWTNQYLDFVKKIKIYEQRSNFVQGLEYLKNQESVFGKTFEPYVTKLALFTYKSDENNPKIFVKALKIINKLVPSHSSSSEVLGLNASIHNRLFKFGMMDSETTDKWNNIFYFSKEKVYSFGTYVLSRIYLSSNKYKVNSLKPYLSKGDAKNTFKRMQQKYPSIIKQLNSRDAKYLEDTKLLIDLALGLKIDETNVKNLTTKQAIMEIKEWLKENND